MAPTPTPAVKGRAGPVGFPRASTGIHQTSWLPPRSEMKKSCLPSGDQIGLLLKAFPRVTGSGSLPSHLTDQIWDVDTPTATKPVLAMRSPSGDQAGSEYPTVSPVGGKGIGVGVPLLAGTMYRLPAVA